MRPFDPFDAVPDVADATAELHAARERLEREQGRVLADTRTTVIAEMLPVLDNLDRSLDAAADDSAPALLEGVRMVQRQFEDALVRLGLERIASVGERFDPALFDAVATIEVEDRSLSGSVVDEWQRGYRLGDRIVRRPKVRVAQWSGAGPG